MVSKKDVISGIVIVFVAVPAILLILFKVGVIPDLMTVVELIVAETLAALLLYGLGLIFVGLRKNMPIELGNTNVPSPSKKGNSWFSRHRIFVKEDQITNFWFIVATFGIFGPFMIMIAYSFNFPITSSSSPLFTLDVIKATMIGIGIFFLGLTAWLAGNQLYNMWESKQQLIIARKSAYKKLTKDFDYAFDAVREVSEPNTKMKMLSDFQCQLDKLCSSEYEWNLVKDRIDKVFQFLIPDKFFNDSFSERYIQILATILNCYKANVISTINTKWSKELETLFNDSKYRTDNIATIFIMLQEIKGYSDAYLEKIIDDAVINWSQLKFNLLVRYIGFAKLKELDEAASLRVLQYLRRKMEQAAQANKEDESTRLETIYDFAKKSG